MFDSLRKISKILLVLSKITVILFGFYYIFHWKEYSISLNVPEVLKVYVLIGVPLKLLESLGMILFIIPMTIIILSFLHPEKIWLKMSSNMCAVGGNLFTISHLFSKGLWEDYFKTFFMTIFNQSSLESKISIFMISCNNRIDAFASMKGEKALAYKNFIQTQLDKFMVSYIEKLKSLPKKDVVDYAWKIADDLNHSYALLHINNNVVYQTKSLFSLPTIGGAILTVAVVYLLFRMSGLNPILQDIGKSILDMGKKMVQFAQSIKKTDEINSDLNKNIGKVAEQTKETAEALKKVYDTTQKNVTNLSETVSHNADVSSSISKVVAENAEALKLLTNVTKNMQKKFEEKIDQGEISKDFCDDILTSIEDLLQPLVDSTIHNSEYINTMGPVSIKFQENTTERVKSLTNLCNELTRKMQEVIADTSSTSANAREAAINRMEKNYGDGLNMIKQMKDDVANKMTNVESNFKKQVLDLKAEIDIRIKECQQFSNKETTALGAELKDKMFQNSERTKERLGTIDDQIKKLVDCTSLASQNQDKASEQISRQHDEVSKVKDEVTELTNKINTQKNELSSMFHEINDKVTVMQKKIKEHGNVIRGLVKLRKEISEDNRNISAGVDLDNKPKTIEEPESKIIQQQEPESRKFFTTNWTDKYRFIQRDKQGFYNSVNDK